jgi:hypothetical protein
MRLILHLPAIRKLHILVVSLLAIATCQCVSAETILHDNLNATWPGSTLFPAGRIVGFIWPDRMAWAAQQFSTDARSYSLATITISFRGEQGHSNAPTPQVYVFSDGGGMPGAPLGTLTPPELSAGLPQLATFTTSSIALSPSTTYWTVLKVQDQNLTWDVTGDLSGSGIGFSPRSAHSLDGGLTWSASQTMPNMMKVVATEVPEPRTVGLLLAAAIGLVIEPITRRLRVVHSRGQTGTYYFNVR